MQQKYGRRQGLESGILNFCVSAGLLSVMAVSVAMIRKDMMSNDMYAVAVILSIYVFTPVIGISTMARNFGIMQSATDRVFSVLETPETVTDMVRKSKKITGYPDISFDNVMFRYGDDLSLVLDDVSFKVFPG